MREPKVNKTAVGQIVRHINHHGGVFEYWKVGIEEKGSDRDNSADQLPMRFDIRNADDARATMSYLLDMGLLADDEYDADPTMLFIYAHTLIEK